MQPYDEKVHLLYFTNFTGFKVFQSVLSVKKAQLKFGWLFGNISEPLSTDICYDL